jgi:DnaD/phage-associated family protein
VQGWIKLHRKIIENPIFSDPFLLKLWIYCLVKASHKEHDQLVGNQIVHLQPGQFITGRQSLHEDYNKDMKPAQKVAESTLWRWLNNFEKWQKVNIKKTNKFSIITILNWDSYQESEQQVNIKWTSNEQQMDTNKNVKNVKNDKEIDPTTTADPAPKEYNFYLTFQRAFGRVPTPLQSQDICNYIDKDGLEERLICYGLEKASKAGKDYGYAARIFGKWKSKGIFTYECGVKEQEEFEQCKKKVVQSNQNRTVKKDRLPEWVEQNETHTPKSLEADEQKRKRAEELMQQLEQSEQKRGIG